MLRSSRGSATSVKDILCPAPTPPLLSEIDERREQLLYRRRPALGRPSRFSQDLLDCLPNRNATFGLPTPRGDATAKDLLSPPLVAASETESKPRSTGATVQEAARHDAQSQGLASPPRRRHESTGSQVKVCMAWADSSDDAASSSDRFKTMSQVPLKQALELHHQHGARPQPRPSHAATRTATSNPITWGAPATDRRPASAKKPAAWAVSRKIGSHHDNPEPPPLSAQSTQPVEARGQGNRTFGLPSVRVDQRAPLPHRKRISDTKNYGDLLSVGDLLSPAAECLYHPDVVRRMRLQLGFVDELDETPLDSP
ncbi:hypothetical protein AMAG_17818 [Allomyces macrogynus ATCC 38327]|uniref:Uncharacterized protein n=1 Tax=Allomyces macrogynus (strain ATCC 38327) TaxID=578462 RepID=A0A0L0RZ94_ALLM3|nr:hypothetical protein AMAG_17818 [Allomyces macrogynus ATCC 38327]|eukprot:KNE55747.1 hypothetical protein AMAG_17818 [Allomyces macrogynus ATCC 38327]